jgi:centromeric protein E
MFLNAPFLLFLGTRQREGAFINKSLLALGKVVRLLSDQSKHRNNSTKTGAAAYAYSSASPHHIPFRESKLTRLLQPSLGGNGKVCLVCTITPSVTCVDESLSTLAFASRAKLVQQTPTLNEAPPDQATLIER